ncbi:TraB/GumN family protein [Leminorella richardii]|nr:TraB/GumN family protein [Leminorella richardii]
MPIRHLTLSPTAAAAFIWSAAFIWAAERWPCSPLSLRQRIAQADALIVEVDISQPIDFDIQPPSIPLTEKLSGQEYQQLLKRSRQVGLREESFESKPAWHIALMLQAMQAERSGLKSEFGIDYQSILTAREKALSVIELEGADKQMALLKRLPEEGLPLLRDTLTHWRANQRLMLIMVRWWLNEKPQRETLQLPYGMGDEIYRIMVTERNRDWAKRLNALPKGNYVVVVGALHLFGEQSLPEILRVSP